MMEHLKENTQERIPISGNGGHVDDPQEYLIKCLTDSQGWLYGHILTMLPDSNAANDILQQTNLIIWRSRDQFDPSRSFLGWASRIAYFQVLAYFRDRKRAKYVYDSDLVESLANEYNDNISIDDVSHRRAALRDCLSKLPEKDKLMILERYAPDISVQTIANRTGKTVNAISRALYRIRGVLASCIERTELVGENNE